MLLVGSDDGVYRVSDALDTGATDVTKTLDSGRVLRVRTFDAIQGAFAATTTGLFHASNGESWTDLGAPEEAVYAVGATPSGDRLYAGTRPAHVYVTALPGDGTVPGAADLVWRDLSGFQDLPSREDWGLPRHDDVAEVRDVLLPTADRVIAGVEVGGVHMSDDGGETWEERRGDAHDDVHELLVLSEDEWLSATGYGLFRTRDAGRRWTRLDEGFPQRYFRALASLDGAVYAAGALANSSTWDDPDADPELFAVREGSLDRIALPTTDETVTGMTAVDGALVAGTHRGTLLVGRPDDWAERASFPVPAEPTGRYTPLASLSA